jgi:hypothetical protein
LHELPHPGARQQQPLDDQSVAWLPDAMSKS